MVEANTAFHTQCRTQTSFSLLAAPSAANTPSQFCFSVLSFLRRKPRNNCPQNIVMHVLFSAYLYEVLGYCQVFYLNFVTCEKIHYKYLFLTGIFIILDFCNSPAINNETIASKSAAPTPAPSLLRTLLQFLTVWFAQRPARKQNKIICSSPGLYGVLNSLYGLGDVKISPS